jgi:hypothetical protein
MRMDQVMDQVVDQVVNQEEFEDSLNGKVALKSRQDNEVAKVFVEEVAAKIIEPVEE